MGEQLGKTFVHIRLKLINFFLDILKYPNIRVYAWHCAEMIQVKCVAFELLISQHYFNGSIPEQHAEVLVKVMVAPDILGWRFLHSL